MPKPGERPKPGFLGLVLYPTIAIDEHNTLDGSLRVDDVDWPRGKLDLTIVYVDKKTSSAIFRWKNSGGLMTLQSFSGGYVETERVGSRTEVEFRIPEYTSVVDVPMEFKGLRPAETKEWDELMAGLDSADRIVWEEIKADRKNRPRSERILKKAKATFPDWEAINSGKRKMTPEEEARLDRVMEEAAQQEMETWLRSTQFSTVAQGKILARLQRERHF